MEYFVLIFFILISLAALFSHVFGLPGNFIILGAAVVCGWLGGFEEFTVKLLIILLGIALLGELIEFVLGIIGAKKYKSSNKAVVGSIVLGIIGGILGVPFFFGIGAVIGAFIGAFAGAFIVEIIVDKNVNKAVKSGWGAFVGRVAGTMSKVVLGVSMIVITVVSVVRA